MKGILLDFNGTLYFDSKMHIDAFNQTFRELGVPEHDDAYMIANVFGRDNKTIYSQTVRKNGSAEEIEAFAARKESLYQQFCLAEPRTGQLAKGVPEFLDTLQEKGIPFCLATGSDWINVQFYIDHLGLSKWFTKDRIVYCDKTYPGKPAPDIYRIAAARLGLSPSDCLVFEDGTSGVLAANRAGVGGVILVHEEGYPVSLPEEAHINGEFYDFTNWKTILTEYGLI